MDQLFTLYRTWVNSGTETLTGRRKSLLKDAPMSQRAPRPRLAVATEPTHFVPAASYVPRLKSVAAIVKLFAAALLVPKENETVGCWAQGCPRGAQCCEIKLETSMAYIGVIVGGVGQLGTTWNGCVKLRDALCRPLYIKRSSQHRIRWRAKDPYNHQTRSTVKNECGTSG